MLKAIDEKYKPTRGTKNSACIDLRARGSFYISKMTTETIPLGVVIDIDSVVFSTCMFCGSEELSQLSKEDTYCDCCGSKQTKEFLAENFYIDLKIRSNYRKKGIISGSGVIDLDFNKELALIVHNFSDSDLVVEDGERVGQVMIKKHYTDMFGIHTEEKRTDGFGSTGKE